jgi:hypothetical protein
VLHGSRDVKEERGLAQLAVVFGRRSPVVPERDSLQGMPDLGTDSGEEPFRLTVGAYGKNFSQIVAKQGQAPHRAILKIEEW